MRFARLQIPAFGPFTNFDLSLPEAGADLHLVYGQNEAGKSSLLRAIRDLLFGIEARSPDNFQHDYSSLRIRGEIVNKSGQCLVLQRRKGNRNTLLGAGDQPLPDSALAPFLGSVDRAYFTAMFGLGPRELHEGAKALLQGHGDLGQALFSASLGGTPIQKVLAGLTEEADRLFKGRATASVTIRPAMNLYRELQREVRQGSVDPEEWMRLERNLAEAQVNQDRLKLAVQEVRRKLDWTNRFGQALPLVADLISQQEELSALPLLPELPGDFAERARDAAKLHTRESDRVRRLTQSVEKLQIDLTAFGVNIALLSEAEALEQLHQEVRLFRERRKQLESSRGERDSLELVLRGRMDSLQLAGEIGALGRHRISSPIQTVCEELAQSVTDFLAGQARTTTRLEELDREIREDEVTLQALPVIDLDELREALADAAEATEADRTLSAAETEVRQRQRAVSAQHGLLAGAPADLLKTAQLPVPASATIRTFQQRREGLERDLRQVQEQIEQSSQQRDTVQLELDRLQRRGALPTLEALRAARNQRDRGWCLVLAEWRGSGASEELIPGMALEESFPQTIAAADEIADQLRLEAESVAQAEEKQCQIQSLEHGVVALQQKAGALNAALEQCQSEWNISWEPAALQPLSPAEMQEWHEQWMRFRQELTQCQAAEEALARKKTQVQEACRKLRQVLGRSADAEFRTLFAAVRDAVQRGEQQGGQRLLLEGSLRRRRSERADLQETSRELAGRAESELGRWRAQCLQVGLPEGLSPAAGLRLLQERRELIGEFERWQTLATEVGQLEQANQQFETSVRQKATSLQISGDSVESLEAALWAALKGARQAADRRQQLTERLQIAKTELEEAQADFRIAEEEFTRFLKLGGLEQPDQLERFLAQLEQRNRLTHGIAATRKSLNGLARGEDLEAFVQQVRAERWDNLESSRTTLEAELEQLEKERQRADETVFQLRNGKETLERATDQAAESCQKAQSCLAGLRRDAARFVRLRVAAQLLQRQIEEFRNANQAPLLQRSGSVFAAITRGAFSGLGAEFDEQDVPVLVGQRPDQSTVKVEGLSDGTRDQLYLALRLAAMERYLESHEPMPLILDDLLITFDDERTRAILPQLVALAQKTQVLLFTHHRHLVELCKETLGEAGFHLHTLEDQVSRRS